MILVPFSCENNVQTLQPGKESRVLVDSSLRVKFQSFKEIVGCKFKMNLRPFLKKHLKLGSFTMMTQPIQVDLGLISSKRIFDLVWSK